VTNSTDDRLVPAARSSTTRVRRRITRQNRVLLVLATAIGLWLGATAPSVSPVRPPAPPPAALAGAPPSVGVGATG
jgi:hypothetical protein